MAGQDQEYMGISPAEARKRYRAKMTYFEWNEILKYRQVWFVGKNIDVKIHGNSFERNNFAYDDNSGNYIFSIGDHLAYRYEILEKIGSGSFGVVLKCMDHHTNQHVAVKILHRRKRNRSINVQNEVNILSFLREKDVYKTGNVVHKLISFTFRNHICIVFGLEGMDLAEVLHSRDDNGLSMDEVRCYAISLLKCLVFLKSIGIVHGDIKPDNIVMSLKDPLTVKLVDFGGSGLSPKSNVAHTKSYTSPETLLGEDFTPAHDMWSLGCTLVKLHTGECMFDADSSSDMMRQMAEVLGKPPTSVFGDAPMWEDNFGSYTGGTRFMSRRQRKKSLMTQLGLPKEFAGFIAHCLEYDPKKRLRPKKALQHPWILQQKDLSPTNLPPEILNITMQNSTVTETGSASNKDQGSLLAFSPLSDQGEEISSASGVSAVKHSGGWSG